MASGNTSESIGPTVHRHARKVPNPVDFEACRVARASDRRRVAHLVDVALAMPALEVFADRQPVEFGLTEVVEQSLVEKLPMPCEWGAQSPPPAMWLVPMRS